MFGERLKLARQKEGLSLDELVNKIDKKVSKQAISKYERGEMMPSSDVLALLIDALNTTLGFVFGNTVTRLERVDFRKKSTTPIKDILKVEAQTIDSAERYIQIEQILGLETNNFTPPSVSGLLESMDDAETLANNIRQAWNLGTDAIGNLTEILEEQGIKVLMLDLPPKVSGKTCEAVASDGYSVPVIIVNKNMPLERRRFTLAHELAHKFINEQSSINIEKAADRFAGAFLIPSDHLLKEVGKRRTVISQPEILELKKLYRVSAASMLQRLQQLSVISETRVMSARMTYAKKWRTQEPSPLEEKDSEQPKRFERLCYRALSEDMISRSKAASLLGIPIAEVDKMWDVQG